MTFRVGDIVNVKGTNRIVQIMEIIVKSGVKNDYWVKPVNYEDTGLSSYWSNDLYKLSKKELKVLVVLES